MVTLLQDSILGYRRMLSLLAELQGLDLDQNTTILGIRERFAALQAELEERDGRINLRLTQDTLLPEWVPLLEQRRELLRELSEANRLIAPRLTAMMALVQAELSEVRTGRSAMAGYAQGTRGKIRGFKAKG